MNWKLERPQRLVKGMLGFKWNGDHFRAQPDQSFMPKGLMIWDAPEGAWLTQTLISNQMQILASWDPVPVRFFTSAWSFEQIAKQLETGIEPPTWCEFDSCDIGNTIRVFLTDGNRQPILSEKTAVAMWGLIKTY